MEELLELKDLLLVGNVPDALLLVEEMTEGTIICRMG